MTYTAQNIENIKRDGLFEEYVRMERDLVNRLESAKIADNGEMIELAHFHGWYGVEKEGPKFTGWAHSATCSFDKQWQGFDSFAAASAYARAALRNRITETSSAVLANARARLAQLEASA